MVSSITPLPHGQTRWVLFEHTCCDQFPYSLFSLSILHPFTTVVDKSVLSYCLRFDTSVFSSKSAIKILAKFFKHLDTRNSSLDTQFSITSRIEFQVGTVNLHLHGTVPSRDFPILDHAAGVWPVAQCN